MKVRRMLSGILSALFLLGVLLLVGTAAAGTWECNFEAPGDASLWTPINEGGPKIGAGEWEIKDGAYHQTVTDSLYHKAIGGDPGWTDYSVEFDMTVLEGRAVAGVLLRANSDGSSGYRLIIHDAGKFAVGPWIDDTYPVSYAESPFAAEAGRDYHVEFSVEGWTLLVSVDGEQIMDYELKDEERLFESGMVGLINYACHVSYDNIKVSGPDIELSPVEVQMKLPVIWGQIKRVRLDQCCVPD